MVFKLFLLMWQQENNPFKKNGNFLSLSFDCFYNWDFFYLFFLLLLLCNAVIHRRCFCSISISRIANIKGVKAQRRGWDMRFENLWKKQIKDGRVQRWKILVTKEDRNTMAKKEVQKCKREDTSDVACTFQLFHTFWVELRVWGEWKADQKERQIK